MPPSTCASAPSGPVHEEEPRWQRQLRPGGELSRAGHLLPHQHRPAGPGAGAMPGTSARRHFLPPAGIHDAPAADPPPPAADLFFDLDDVEHISFARQIRQPPTRLMTKLYYLQIPALWWGERQAMQRAVRTFVCSQLDQSYLSKRCGLDGVVAIPNAVAIPPEQPPCPDPTLMLIGGYYYYPNLNAANFFD